MSDREVELQALAVMAENGVKINDIAYAFKVEERIKGLGLEQRYAYYLFKQLPAKFRLDLDQWFEIAHASPEQRCRAALECVKEKAKAAGG